MLEQMADLGFIWDISHLTDEGVWQGLDLGFPRVCASHANAKALAPTDRHLSDEVIRAVAERGGVIGLVLTTVFSSLAGAGIDLSPSRSTNTCADTRTMSQAFAVGST